MRDRWVHVGRLWTNGDPKETETAFFRKTFEIKGKPKAADAPDGPPDAEDRMLERASPVVAAAIESGGAMVCSRSSP